MDKLKVGVGFGVMLKRGGEILLGLRHSDPDKADSELHGEGTWTMPGGKIHFGESFEDAASREVFEETGIKIQKSDLQFVSLTNDQSPDAQFVTIGFLCEKFVGEPKVMEPDEIVEWRWFEIDNIPKRIFFPSKKLLRNYLNKTIYQIEK